MKPRGIVRRIESGRLAVVHPTVYRVGGAPTSWEQRILAACLWAGEGAVASHRCAARLWELAEVECSVPEITTIRDLRTDRLVVHRSYCLSLSETTTLGPIPITDPTRTLLDLGCQLSLRKLELAFEDCLRRGLTEVDFLYARLQRWARSGRTGVRKWRFLLDQRDPRARPTDSSFETRMVQLLRRHGLPPPVRQHPIRGADGSIDRVDLAYVREQVSIELDSVKFHLNRPAWERDLAKRNRLIEVGWLPLNFTWATVMRDADRVTTQVGAVLASRRSSHSLGISSRIATLSGAQNAPGVRGRRWSSRRSGSSLLRTNLRTGATADRLQRPRCSPGCRAWGPRS